ncbi:DNA adenine methylase [Sphingobacterium siyangense]|uniref:DNA adenine methylase n=1 Tax=Sphingobacterium siyangense TaxID=459529 RepID=UPI00200E9AFB|nr:DNA adenine methylase [Sphingobacterium siyangense]UQA76718.1 DNA adenine methylase [Sphingobacterium siyangense]
MRFIGNKELIISDIKNLFEKLDLLDKELTLFDAFCGTGAVSDSLKDSFNTVSNDMLKWCTIYTRGRVCANKCTFEKLAFDPILFLNTNNNIIKGFFYRNYSPAESERMYFTIENAGRIDYFREVIENWKIDNLITDDEYAYLLACLLESVSVVSNTAGVYGAFLKHWDSRALKPIEFKRVPAKDVQPKNTEFSNSRLEDIISDIECDILYLDPPYTQNQYGTQYHLLETLILNDNPSLSKITGSRPTTSMRSDWSKNYKSHILFDKILAKTKAKYVVFSYSKDGFMSKSFIEASMKRYGKPETFVCKKLNYKKYTNFKSKEDNEHFEYLFYIEKKLVDHINYESPLNYIGSKSKMASFIKTNMPQGFNKFIDAFGGGFNVGININTDHVLYNDLNHFVCGLVESFKITDTYQYILYLKKIIKKFELQAKNAESYNKLRDYYNSFPIAKRDPKLLYSLILYGFNQQIRFNGNHDFNNPVGMRWFNDKVLEKMISFSRVIKEKNVSFESKNYEELIGEIDNFTFTYLDPPYMLTNGSYNDGKRGFLGWNSITENKLFNFVDCLSLQQKPFMISYVLEHKGDYNLPLDKWVTKRGYNVLNVDPILGNNRKEILITNYNAGYFQNKEEFSEIRNHL